MLGFQEVPGRVEKSARKISIKIGSTKVHGVAYLNPLGFTSEKIITQIFTEKLSRTWVFPKNRAGPPQIINSNRVFRFSLINHPFWWFSPYFWFNTHLTKICHIISPLVVSGNQVGPKASTLTMRRLRSSTTCGKVHWTVAAGMFFLGKKILQQRMTQESQIVTISPFAIWDYFWCLFDSKKSPLTTSHDKKKTLPAGDCC